MIYELRTYRAMPGRLPDLLRLFDDEVLDLFVKHGIDVVGCWTNEIGAPNDELVYMIRFDDLGHRDRAWSAFRADPAFAQTNQRADVDGRFLVNTQSRILLPVPFSRHSFET